MRITVALLLCFAAFALAAPACAGVRATEGARHELAEHPAACPLCGASPVARISYGKPAMNDALRQEIEAGRLQLGGCVLTGDDPRWHCTACGVYFFKKEPPAAFTP